MLRTRKGFANGAFEDLAEDVPALVEEFYPESETGDLDGRPGPTAPATLGSKLEAQVSRVATG